jgi:hypothetical protein
VLAEGEDGDEAGDLVDLHGGLLSAGLAPESRVEGLKQEMYFLEH